MLKYANSLKWPSTVRREPEERPDLTGPREVPDRVGARQTETESQDDAEDRGEPHHGLGCGVRSTRSYGSYSFRRVGCLLSNSSDTVGLPGVALRNRAPYGIRSIGNPDAASILPVQLKYEMSAVAS
jgi:hypothetical protein